MYCLSHLVFCNGSPGRQGLVTEPMQMTCSVLTCFQHCEAGWMALPCETSGPVGTLCLWGPKTYTSGWQLAVWGKPWSGLRSDFCSVSLAGSWHPFLIPVVSAVAAVWTSCRGGSLIGGFFCMQLVRSLNYWKYKLSTTHSLSKWELERILWFCWVG